jgi:hypothetical protein
MIKFLDTRSNTLSADIFDKKFTGKRILVMGSGPSLQFVNWQNIDVDHIVTTTFFYLNDVVRNLTNITHITLSEIIDFDDYRLHEFFENNPECTIALEPKQGRPFYSTLTYKKFEERYQERLVYYNTNIDKQEGVAGRLTFFVMSFAPSELYYVGIDGFGPIREKSPNNSFRKNLVDADNGLHSYEKFIDSHQTMASALHEQTLQNGCKLYNLGEGFEFNCSTPYSKRYFPLNEEIKRKIKL